MKKSMPELVADGICLGVDFLAGCVKIAYHVDQTFESRKRTKELERQTEIMIKEAETKIEEEKKRTALIREKKLAEMTPDERAEFEVSEMLDRVKIRMEK